MKRIGIGIGILLAILALSLAATGQMQRIHIPMAQLLEDAAREAEAGNLLPAQQAAEAAASLWEESRVFTAILADHSPMDDMDGLFAELQTYTQFEELPHFAAVCRHLARLARSMGENHSAQWWNLL